jgi:hypothetical protein
VAWIGFGPSTNPYRRARIGSMRNGRGIVANFGRRLIRVGREHCRVLVQYREPVEQSFEFRDEVRVRFVHRAPTPRE